MDDDFAMMDAPILLGLYAFPWGFAVLDSDGLCDGLRAWGWGDERPFFFEVGSKDELIAMLDGLEP